MTDAETADTLDAAADYLDTHGWRQRAMGGHGLPACSLGAIDSVEGSRRQRTLAKQALAARVTDDPVDWSHVALWNDAEHRTAEQVTKEMRAAAAELRQVSA